MDMGDNSIRQDTIRLDNTLIYKYLIFVTNLSVSCSTWQVTGTHTDTQTHRHPFSSSIISVCGLLKKIKKKKKKNLQDSFCRTHVVDISFTIVWCSSGANLWIMNTDLLGSVPALLPTGRPWRHARQRPSADCSSLISRLHSAAPHSHSSRTFLRLIPASREDAETTVMLKTGLWVNWAGLRNGNPTDNCTQPLTCYDE